MRIFTLFIVLIIGLSSCKKSNIDFKIPETKTLVSNSEIQLIKKDGNTIKSRFLPPKDFHWVEEKPESFGYFIENFELEPYGSPILKYDGSPIATQNLHEAIFKIDVGTKDLQQCADAVMRLRAEFLWKEKRFDEIAFHFTSGDLVKWIDYKKGVRPIINGSTVSFAQSAKENNSYENFRNYLDLIFNYAGTISLTKETKAVKSNSDLKSGDILITPGSPGHVVFIAGVTENKKGEKRYLLGEGFTPAQSIHILKNPFDKGMSPWYNLDIDSEQTKTARYHFSPTNFRTF